MNYLKLMNSTDVQGELTSVKTKNITHKIIKKIIILIYFFKMTFFTLNL